MYLTALMSPFITFLYHSLHNAYFLHHKCLYGTVRELDTEFNTELYLLIKLIVGQFSLNFPWNIVFCPRPIRPFPPGCHNPTPQVDLIHNVNVFNSFDESLYYLLVPFIADNFPSGCFNNANIHIFCQFYVYIFLQYLEWYFYYIVFAKGITNIPEL